MPRFLAAAHAILAGALAALILGPLEPIADAAGLLAMLLGIAAGAGLVGVAAFRDRAGRPARAAGAAAAVLAPAGVWALAYAAAAAEPGGSLRALGAVAACAVVGFGAARAGRKRGGGVAIAAAILLAGAAPLLRFCSIALYGRDRPGLGALSPLELPGMALASGLARAAEAGGTASGGGGGAGARFSSATAGLFRRGVPVEVAADGPGAFAAGEPPRFEARAAGPLHPTLHDRPPAGGPIAWQPVLPGERLRFAPRPGGGGGGGGGGAARPPESRRDREGWLLVGREPPRALAALEAFDDLPEPAPAAFRVLAAHRRGAHRPPDPAVDPARYDALEPPRIPDGARDNLARAALGVAFVVAAAAVLAPARLAAAATLLAALAAGGAALGLSGAAGARAVLAERAVFRLLPGEPEAVRVDWIDAGAPAAPARPSFRVAPCEGLAPVLAARPETAAYAIARAAEPAPAEDVRGLPLGPGGRRLFRAIRAVRLPGPIEVAPSPGAGPPDVVNRTGVDFAEAFHVRADSAARAGPLEDGASLAAAAFEPPVSFFRLGESLDARGRDGRALRRLLTQELAGIPAPPGGWLVLVGRAPAEPAVAPGAKVLAREAGAAVYIVAIP